MNARAKASVFWPGITIQIQELRNNCQACHRIAPSNPKPPPTPSPDPVYPFQMICADYFCYGGHNKNYYLVIVDRYSVWPCVSTHGSVTCTRQEATGIVRDIRHRGRIGIRWRPRIHGRFHPAVPPRLGSCPPPLVSSLSAFQHPGRDRGQVSQAHDHHTNDLQGQQLNPHSLNFEPNTEDAGTPATSPRPSAENTPSPAAKKNSQRVPTRSLSSLVG